MSCLPFHKNRLETKIQAGLGFRVLSLYIVILLYITVPPHRQGFLFAVGFLKWLLILLNKKKCHKGELSLYRNSPLSCGHSPTTKLQSRSLHPVPTCSPWIRGDSIQLPYPISLALCILPGKVMSSVAFLAAATTLPGKYLLRHWLMFSNTCFPVFICSCGTQDGDVVKDRVFWAPDSLPMVKIYTLDDSLNFSRLWFVHL